MKDEGSTLGFKFHVNAAERRSPRRCQCRAGRVEQSVRLHQSQVNAHGRLQAPIYRKQVLALRPQDVGFVVQICSTKRQPGFTPFLCT